MYCFGLRGLRDEPATSIAACCRICQQHAWTGGTKFESWTTYTQMTPFFDLKRGLEFNVVGPAEPAGSTNAVLSEDLFQLRIL